MSDMRPFRPSPDRPLAIREEALETSYPKYKADRVADVLDGGIAVVCIEDPLVHKSGGWFDSYESIFVRFKNAIECDEIRAVLLKIDSPGGEAAGVFETVKRMRKLAADQEKPVFAYADEAAYSAAYALACAAEEIYVPPGGGVGSVGVITTMVDVSTMDRMDGIRVEVIKSGTRKADGHPHVPLTDEVIARAQRRVNDLAKLFIRQVSDARGLSPRDLQALEAGVFYDKKAVRAGLADGVMSLDEVVDAIRYMLDNGSAAGSLHSASVQNARTRDDSEKAMANRLALMKALKDADEALKNAKTTRERREAAKAYATAEARLTATSPPRADDEDDEDDEDEESESESEASESEAGSDPSSTGGSSTGSDGSDDDSSMSEEEGAKVRRGEPGLYTAQRLLRMVEKATGERGYERAMGALDAILRERAETSKLRVKLEKRVAKLEAKEKGDRLEALIQRGIVEGKLTPAMRAWAKGQSHDALEAYLKAAPARVVREAEASEADESEENMANEREATAAEAKVFGLLGLTNTDTGKDLTKEGIALGGKLARSFEAKRAGASGEIKMGTGHRKFTINGVSK